MAAILEAEVAKRFKRFDLEAKLAFRSGITAIVGSSGSGKTTLLRCLAGLEHPERGRITYGDEVWFETAGRRLAPQKRRIGFVFNDYALFPQLTVLENIRYGARDRNRVSEWLEMLELKPLADHYPRQLSAGQQQRVAIARALASEPRLLLMDEPFSSLDPHLKERVYAQFLTLQRQLGIPVLLVTHDLAEASFLAREMVVMAGGRVLQTGTPQEVFLAPRTREVAHLAGIRNVFEGRLAADGRLHWGEHVLTLPACGRAPRPVEWCIRAEAVEIGRPGEPNLVSAVVEAVGMMGSAYRVVCELERMGTLEVRVPFAKGQAMPSVGESLWLRLPPDAIHLLGEAPGSSLIPPVVSGR